MRLYACNSVGTGNPLDRFDSIRPVVTSPDHRVYLPVTGRGSSVKFLVLDFDAVGVVANTYDLGDPQNAADMNRTLTNPEASTVAGLFVDDPTVNNRTFRGFTIVGVAEWCDTDPDKSWTHRFVRALFEVV